MIEVFGGPDRDRTDDLFHAMEMQTWSAIESKRVNDRIGRQNRHKQRNLLPNCYQIERVGSKG